MKIGAIFAALVSVLTSATALADDPIRPNPSFTPGEILTTQTDTVCQPGYSRAVRHTSGRLKAFVYEEYGINRKEGHYEVDHLIPLSLGGADSVKNLWPESYDTEPWNAAVKDKLEDFLHREVCAGRIPLAEAQREIAHDWISTYQRYLGMPAQGARAVRP